MQCFAEYGAHEVHRILASIEANPVGLAPFSLCADFLHNAHDRVDHRRRCHKSFLMSRPEWRQDLHVLPFWCQVLRLRLTDSCPSSSYRHHPLHVGSSLAPASSCRCRCSCFDVVNRFIDTPFSFFAWIASNNACDYISKCYAPHYRAAVKQGFIKDGCKDWSKTVVMILLSQPTGQQWAYVDLVIFLCIIRVTTCRGYDDRIQHCLYNWARLYVVSAGIRTFSMPFRYGRWCYDITHRSRRCFPLRVRCYRSCPRTRYLTSLFQTELRPVFAFCTCESLKSVSQHPFMHLHEFWGVKRI